MHHEPITVADVEVIPLCDGSGPMGPSLRRPLPELFPGAAPEDWAGTPDPEWVLHFHCYLLRDRRGRTVLVDTGIGGLDSPAASWAPVPGSLTGELAAAGVAPADIDVVVLTHLHSDHASGATDGVAPAFPGARYVLQRAEVDWVTGPVRDYVLTPLADHLDVVDGDAEVLPGIRVRHTPGHTPGHQVVRVGPLTLTGDLILHPVQLRNPRITYRYDTDPTQAAATRATLLDELRGSPGATVATAHFPIPFTPLS
ncbi:MBL fold metallo-hydrolase [Actinophytocola sp.]|uniref:MBL fold metallo-hydrolase n=1 Tax=Actinophytocola sp. TaxID=1872138 RepID=UPI002D7E6D6C|nr:MBL fold metallo-hydrolase [Actinophytocola sp.]HET9142405.1 MBL fold metallo-hydrolase [Actinophytocola sp.]